MLLHLKSDFTDSTFCSFPQLQHFIFLISNFAQINIAQKPPIMAYRTAVSTPNAPAPLPQFSQAVTYNKMIYCSGNIGLDPATGKLVSGTVTDRTRQALRNLSAVLAAGGSSTDRVVKANIFLTTMDDFAAMNVAWDEVFTEDPKPVSYKTAQRGMSRRSQLMFGMQCRTCVAVHQLPFGTDVEIEMTASCE